MFDLDTRKLPAPRIIGMTKNSPFFLEITVKIDRWASKEVFALSPMPTFFYILRSLGLIYVIYKNTMNDHFWFEIDFFKEKIWKILFETGHTSLGLEVQ